MPLSEKEALISYINGNKRNNCNESLEAFVVPLYPSLILSPTRGSALKVIKRLSVAQELFASVAV
jgi:hypothetical protein